MCQAKSGRAARSGNQSHAVAACAKLNMDGTKPIEGGTKPNMEGAPGPGDTKSNMEGGTRPNIYGGRQEAKLTQSQNARVSGGCTSISVSVVSQWRQLAYELYLVGAFDLLE